MNTINQQEITMITTPRTCNTLKQADFYKLNRWIELNHATLKGKTQEQIKNIAAEATGLTITVSNLHAVAKTLGLPLGSRTPNPGGIPTDINRALARAMRDLYRRLGEEVPTAIEAIASR